MDLIDRMFGHDSATTAAYLELCENLTDEQWDKEVDVGHRTLRSSFEHMIESVEFWTTCMLGAPAQRELEYQSRNQFITEHHATYQRFEACARAVIAENRLDARFVDIWGVSRTYGSTILHVVLHNQTHRTEILHILERLGVERLPEGDPLEWES